MTQTTESPVAPTPASPAEEEIEGLETGAESWGDYPLDEVLIRQEGRTVHEVLRRIDDDRYVMDPDFQRGFIWKEDKQSRLIESVMMRIPLPVFYLAEDKQGRMIVIDGLQRLSTFIRFVKGELALRLPARPDLDGRRFSDLSPKLQNRVEDANLIFYIIDWRIPDRARLDIFERVNGGVPLTRQQMRNSLYQGPGTHFLKEEAATSVFREATGGSLNWKTMRDREFVNRFCAFKVLSLGRYRDMDGFLADCLERMNEMPPEDLDSLSRSFRMTLENNFLLFGKHAFRKHLPDQDRRSVLNASLWDVLSTGLTRYEPPYVRSCQLPIQEGVQSLFRDEEFNRAITYGTNDLRRVRYRFEAMDGLLKDVLGDPTT